MRTKWWASTQTQILRAVESTGHSCIARLFATRRIIGFFILPFSVTSFETNMLRLSLVDEKNWETPHQILAIESNVASNAPLNSPFRTFPVQIWAVHICWTSRKAYAHFMFGGLSTALLVKKRVKSRKPLQLAKTRQNPHVSWLTKLLTHFEWLKVKTCQKLTESLKFIA